MQLQVRIRSKQDPVYLPPAPCPVVAGTLKFEQWTGNSHLQLGAQGLSTT